MNILSLFDGMSCGQIALNNLNIKYDNYYASEIDKHAIKVTQHNFPNTIQLGDITQLKGSDLPKIDLLMGGSPCQGFSFAGKQLNFEDSRSKLFFEFVRLKNELNPKYFLLENVKMKKQYQDIINEFLGENPIEINSELVSAQHRRRLYWTNIPNVTQPKDKNIFLNDILEDNIGGIKIDFNEDGIFKHKAKNGKNIILESSFSPPYTIYESRTEEGKRERKRLKKLLGKDTTPRGVNYKEYRINKKNKANCLVATPSELDYIVDRQYNYRLLTLTEMERLQNVPDGYTNVVSDNQRRKMIGNGWTVGVIEHILKNMEI
ncbi:MAG: DNA (cytosine-5-)-methyltransferase [bacterium]